MPFRCEIFDEISGPVENLIKPQKANMTQSDRSDRDRGSVVKVGGWTANPEGILQWCHRVNQQRLLQQFMLSLQIRNPVIQVFQEKYVLKVGDTHRD